MESIKQLSVVLMRQKYTIQAAIASPAISKPLQPNKITTIPKSPHHIPHIIENDDESITPVHRVITHQSNLCSRIIPPETPHPRRM